MPVSCQPPAHVVQIGHTASERKLCQLEDCVCYPKLYGAPPTVHTASSPYSLRVFALACQEDPTTEHQFHEPHHDPLYLGWEAQRLKKSIAMEQSHIVRCQEVY